MRVDSLLPWINILLSDSGPLQVMDKFIKKASEQLKSVLMLFSHSDGFPATSTLQLLNRIGRDKVLPEHLVPFLKVCSRSWYSSQNHHN